MAKPKNRKYKIKTENNSKQHLPWQVLSLYILYLYSPVKFIPFSELFGIDIV